MALSSFETKVSQAILLHPIIYDKSARNVEDVDDKVDLAFHSVQKELKEKYDYNVPMAGLKIIYDKISKRIKDKTLEDKKFSDDEEESQNQESVKSLEQWEDHMKKYGCLDENLSIQKRKQKKANNGTKKMKRVGIRDMYKTVSKKPFVLRNLKIVQDQDNIFRKFLKPSSKSVEKENNCNKELDSDKNIENFTRLFEEVESTAVTNTLKEAESISSTKNTHNTEAILKSFSDHRSCKSTNLQQTNSQLTKFPKLDKFAVSNQKLIGKMDKQFQDLHKLAMESTEIALDNNKENGIYGQLIMELICKVNPEELEVCFDEVLSHFQESYE